MATVDPTSTLRPQSQSAPQKDGMRLGERMLAHGLIDATQLQYALQKNEVEKQRLGRILIRHGLANESDIVRVLAEMKKPTIAAMTMTITDTTVLNLFIAR